MTDIVTGTPAVVGFTNGNDYNRGDYGWSNKDTLFARSVDAGEQTRDILRDVRDNALGIREAIYTSTVATEKTGAANSLAIEKIGAAGILEAAKNAAATQLVIEKTNAAAMLATEKTAAAGILLATQNHAAMMAAQAECCCELKALNLSIESNRVRDQLQLLQTQFLILSGGQTPAVGRGNNS